MLISAVTHWMFAFPLGPVSSLININYSSINTSR